MNTTITFDQVTAVMHHPVMIISFVIIWLLPILIYLLIGAIVKGKSANGHSLSKSMMMYPNYWYALLIWGFTQLILFILVFFPVWLKFL